MRHKILAFERFLDQNPEYQGKVRYPCHRSCLDSLSEQVVLIQVALQTTETNELQGGVADIVSRVNSRYSTLTYQPVIFLHTQVIFALPCV